MRKRGQIPKLRLKSIRIGEIFMAVGNLAPSGTQRAGFVDGEANGLEPERLRSAWRYAYVEAPLSPRTLLIE